MKKITGLVICGFPGTGETTGNDVIYLDSSVFRWFIDGCFTRKERTNWVSNYADYITKLATNNRYRFVIVSTHERLRKELDERGIPYVVVVPNRTLRDEYMLRYIRNGYTPSLIERIYHHWDEWLDDIEESKSVVIHLDAGQTIADVLGV